MATWTNDVFKETVEINGKQYKNCAIMKMGCFKGDNGAIDCRNCNIPLLFPSESAAYLKSRMGGKQ